MNTGLRITALSLALLLGLLVQSWGYSPGKIYSLDALVAAADRIVLVQHLDSTPMFLGKRIVTLQRFVVIETLKGAHATTLEFHQAGGRLAGMDETIPGLPTYAPGELSLLFLKNPKGPGRTSGPLGGLQGKFEAARDSQNRVVIANAFLTRLQSQQQSTIANQGAGRETPQGSLPSVPASILPEKMYLDDLKGKIQ